MRNMLQRLTKVDVTAALDYAKWNLETSFTKNIP